VVFVVGWPVVLYRTRLVGKMVSGMVYVDDNSNHAMMGVALQDFHSGHSGAVIRGISIMVYNSFRYLPKCSRFISHFSTVP